uniref:Uncharacterized protein n=1 Tax=Tanacetum cinerariifolium TaxID=118510 RepID=A0A699GPG1_TANCI|nr:hypothetical protein [Tanacetum cinerariifolium]
MMKIPKNDCRFQNGCHKTSSTWRAILNFASLIWDEFEWQTIERPSIPSKISKLLYTRFTKIIIDYLLLLNKSIPRRSDPKLHSSQDDHPITKLLSTTNGEYKFGMEVPDAMISDAIKKKERYKYYMAKKVESKKAKIVDKPEEQHVSPIKSRRGKSSMCYGDQVANVSNKLKKYVMPRKTRSLTIAEEAVVDELAISISIQEPHFQRRRRSQLTAKLTKLLRICTMSGDRNSKEDDRIDFFKARMSVVTKDIQFGVKSYQRTLNLTKPTMFFEGIDQRIPFTTTATHKGVMYLNQYNIKSLIKLSEVKKFCDGTLVKIQENLIDMLLKNKLGSGNKRLKGRDWTDYDVKSSKETLKKIDEIFRHIEQLKRLEEYVGGRTKTVNPCSFVRPL